MLDSGTECVQFAEPLSSYGSCEASVFSPCSVPLPWSRRNGWKTPTPAGCVESWRKTAPLIVPDDPGVVRSTLFKLAVMAEPVERTWRPSRVSKEDCWRRDGVAVRRGELRRAFRKENQGAYADRFERVAIGVSSKERIHCIAQCVGIQTVGS